MTGAKLEVQRRREEQFVREHRGLVRTALRHAGCRWDEDLEQVALLALVKAMRRFDPSRGCGFAAFAVPTMVGEVKRHLRDHSRLIRPPRALSDLRQAVVAADHELTARNGSPPALTEVAAFLGVELDEVAEALALEERCHPTSLDYPDHRGERELETPIHERIGTEDADLENVAMRLVCRQLLDALEPRLQAVIELRYYQELPQRQVAERLGLSQMHVSRLERRALQELRERLETMRV